MKTDIAYIKSKYLAWHTGEVEEITGSGSNRVYLRLHDGEGHSIIFVYGNCIEENRAFVEMARHFEGDRKSVV